MIINRQIGGSGGESASILISGLASTDTVSATTPSSKAITPTWKNSKWCFEKLIEYGTYTITASNGTKTITQNVLIDVATEYDVEMDLSKLYLYKYGDECESVTGGWSSDGYLFYNGNNVQRTVIAPTKNVDNIYLQGADGIACVTGVANSINFSGYNSIKIIASASNQESQGIVWDDSKTLNKSNTWAAAKYRELTNLNLGLVSVDISSINKNQYVVFWAENSTYRQISIYAVWLE